MENTEISAHNLDFGYIGWKYYNKIKKKAMEQEFSWAGLLLSLSIAFFIIIFTAFSLSFVYETVNQARSKARLLGENFYRLETINENYIQTGFISAEKIERVERLNLA